MTNLAWILCVKWFTSGKRRRNNRCLLILNKRAGCWTGCCFQIQLYPHLSTQRLSLTGVPCRNGHFDESTCWSAWDKREKTSTAAVLLLSSQWSQKHSNTTQTRPASSWWSREQRDGTDKVVRERSSEDAADDKDSKCLVHVCQNCITTVTEFEL